MKTLTWYLSPFSSLTAFSTDELGFHYRRLRRIGFDHQSAKKAAKELPEVKEGLRAQKRSFIDGVVLMAIVTAFLGAILFMMMAKEWLR